MNQFEYCNYPLNPLLSVLNLQVTDQFSATNRGLATFWSFWILYEPWNNSSMCHSSQIHRASNHHNQLCRHRAIRKHHLALRFRHEKKTQNWPQTSMQLMAQLIVNQLRPAASRPPPLPLIRCNPPGYRYVSARRSCPREVLRSHTLSDQNEWWKA